MSTTQNKAALTGVCQASKAEMDHLASDNIRLVLKFVYTSCSRRTRRLFGGGDELVADLMVPYMLAIHGWLASDQFYPLSTFVYHRLKWFVARNLYASQLISFKRRFDKKKPPGEKSPRRKPKKIRSRRRIQAMTLAQSRDCTDASVVYHDDVGRLLDLRDVTQVVQATLSSEQWWLLKQKYGLDGADGATMAAIAKTLGKSRQRMEQRCKTALEQVRESMERNGLDETDFI